VGRPGAPDARDERQRRHGRSERTGHKERTLFVQMRALSFRRKMFFADVERIAECHWEDFFHDIFPLNHTYKINWHVESIPS